MRGIEKERPLSGSETEMAYKEKNSVKASFHGNKNKHNLYSTTYIDQCRLYLLPFTFIHETARLVKHKSRAQVFWLVALPHFSISRS